MSERLIVGNWKMNLDPHQGSTLVHRLSQKLEPKSSTTIVLCPPFIDLVPLAKEVDRKLFKLGAQNLSDNDDGAYTGEISGAMLKGLVNYTIVGHSERRKYFGEDDKLIARKVAAAVRHNLTPILCVGETLHEREQGLSTKVVVSQLEANLALVDADEVETMVVAYEPVWAIGTGKFATPEEVLPVMSAIRRTVEELFGEAAGMGMKLLYGGSVEPENAGTYLKLDDVDGLLVGGASLNYEKFTSIVKTSQDLD
jgi:triosephosphate isomerase